ncbi:PepSY domain-containing protein [Asanoa sp. NPDC049518]|uniref:PepSY domain-containing protein n=1 Tax=unclassified Asanoa TaxID=2685164 RepID=UPI00343D3260
MKRTTVIVTLAGMAALAVTGTALAATADDGPSPLTGLGSAVPTATAEVSADPTPTVTSTTPPLSGDLGAEEARRIALAKVGGGTVNEIESEFEHGFSTWKVEIVRGGVEHDVYVDRATGTIVKLDRDDDRVAGDRDDSPTHDANDDRVAGGRDDSPTHDANDDRGRHGRGSDDDHDDDHGGHGHGSDD